MKKTLCLHAHCADSVGRGSPFEEFRVTAEKPGGDVKWEFVDIRILLSSSEWQSHSGLQYVFISRRKFCISSPPLSWPQWILMANIGTKMEEGFDVVMILKSSHRKPCYGLVFWY